MKKDAVQVFCYWFPDGLFDINATSLKDVLAASSETKEKN